MSHMQRAGGIRRHELHQHLAVGPAAIAAEGIAQIMDAPHDAGMRVARQEEIDEAGAGDLHFLDGRVLLQRADNGLGQFARRLARDLRQAHGDVGGEVAIGRIAGALHAQVFQGCVRGQHGAREPRQRGVQQLLDFLLQGAFLVVGRVGKSTCAARLTVLPADRRPAPSAPCAASRQLLHRPAATRPGSACRRVRDRLLSTSSWAWCGRPAGPSPRAPGPAARTPRCRRGVAGCGAAACRNFSGGLGIGAGGAQRASRDERWPARPSRAFLDQRLAVGEAVVAAVQQLLVSSGCSGYSVWISTSPGGRCGRPGRPPARWSARVARRRGSPC
jgi:hypothetical protein